MDGAIVKALALEMGDGAIALGVRGLHRLVMRVLRA